MGLNALLPGPHDLPPIWLRDTQPDETELFWKLVTLREMAHKALGHNIRLKGDTKHGSEPKSN